MYNTSKSYNVTQIIIEPTMVTMVMGASSALLDLILCSNTNIVQGNIKLQGSKPKLF